MVVEWCGQHRAISLEGEQGRGCGVEGHILETVAEAMDHVGADGVSTWGALWSEASWSTQCLEFYGVRETGTRRIGFGDQVETFVFPYYEGAMEPTARFLAEIPRNTSFEVYEWPVRMQWPQRESPDSYAMVVQAVVRGHVIRRRLVRWLDAETNSLFSENGNGLREMVMHPPDGVARAPSPPLGRYPPELWDFVNMAEHHIGCLQTGEEVRWDEARGAPEVIPYHRLPPMFEENEDRKPAAK